MIEMVRGALLGYPGEKLTLVKPYHSSLQKLLPELVTISSRCDVTSCISTTAFSYPPTLFLVFQRIHDNKDKQRNINENQQEGK